MKRNKIWLPICLAVALLVLPSCRRENQGPRLQSQTQAQAFPWQIERVVPLETRDEALIGHVGKVAVDPQNGDIWVGDKRSTHRVYHFNSLGRFLGAVGKVGQGPGEYQRLIDFVPLSGDRLLVLAERLMLIYNHAGDVLHQKELDLMTQEVAVSGTHIFVRGILPASHRQRKAIHAYNADLEEVFAFHDQDPRLDKLLYLPMSSMSFHQGTLYVSDIYDLAITAYRVQGNRAEVVAVHTFPNENHQLANPTKTAGFSGRQKQDFIDGLHRFELMVPAPDGLFLFELQRARQHFAAALFQPEQSRLQQWRAWPLLGHQEDRGHLTLSGVAGSYENGIIGFCENLPVLQKYQQQHPEIADVRFTIQDNPVLVFVSLKEKPAARKGDS